MFRADPHPLLDAVVLDIAYPRPLGTPDDWEPRLSTLIHGALPEWPDPTLSRDPIRDLLRHGGFKPSGRNKPASEYLVRAVGEGKLPDINVAVDLLNVASWRSGLPISIVDADLLQGNAHIGIAPPDSSYVFNASGQILKLDGLLCLFDGQGPCGNAVKDSQRTKTRPETIRTLTVIWGSVDLAGRADAVGAWLADQSRSLGATVNIDHPTC